MRIVPLFAVAFVSLVPALARADNSLVKFDGAIGVDGVAGAAGTAPTSAVVTRTIVRGVQPAGTSWAIADFNAEVKSDGHITADGRGLIFSAGDTIGSALVLTPTGTATLQVFATLICESVAPFVERNTNPVPLSAAGDFKINDVLSPAPPASCATPVLLIRVAGAGAWFAAGIQRFDGKH